jgi:hypothetical protein
MTKVVTKIRQKQYYDAGGNVIAKGHETVKEVGLCTECGDNDLRSRAVAKTVRVNRSAKKDHQSIPQGFITIH